VDTYLAITSKRDERRYSDASIPDDVVERILDAGRLTGSAQNRQPWEFLVLEDRAVVERLAEAVYAPANVLGAKLVVAVTIAGRGPTSLDAGRAAQNMMIAAWNDGVVSCPNGLADPDRAANLLGLDGERRLAIVLSFGYPARPRDPDSRPAEEWSRRANRKPLDEIVRRI
jgi:nitroreductase